MSEVVSIATDGAAAARAALERSVLAGGVAIFPADGLYGLACDPLRGAAIERIHAIKGRDDGKPSAIMYFSPLAMRELLAGLGERSREAVAALLPGPLTLVLANPEHRYPLACRDDPGRIGVRLIAGPLAGASCAIFQTSANPQRRAGSVPLRPISIPGSSPPSISPIDGGDLTGQPSTVVDLTVIEAGGGWRILREGAVPVAELEARLREAERWPEAPPIAITGRTVCACSPDPAQYSSPWIPLPTASQPNSALDCRDGVAETRTSPRSRRLDRVRIAIGSDHAGFELKEAVAPALGAAGHELIDVGTDSPESVDYPDPAARAARMVASGEAERAVIVCGSGVGVAIAANKVDGVRAVNAHDAEEAEMSRRHNDANVLTLAGRGSIPVGASRSSRLSWPPGSRAAGTRAGSRRSSRSRTAHDRRRTEREADR